MLFSLSSPQVRIREQELFQYLILNQAFCPGLIESQVSKACFTQMLLL